MFGVHPLAFLNCIMLNNNILGRFRDARDSITFFSSIVCLHKERKALSQPQKWHEAKCNTAVSLPHPVPLFTCHQPYPEMVNQDSIDTRHKSNKHSQNYQKQSNQPIPPNAIPLLSLWLLDLCKSWNSKRPCWSWRKNLFNFMPHSEKTEWQSI